MIEERQAARKARDFKRADEIRDELLAQGIILEDTREGVKMIIAEPYQNGEVSVEGPAVILVVMD